MFRKNLFSLYSGLTVINKSEMQKYLENIDNVSK